MDALHTPLFANPDAAVLFTPQAFVARMLDFEVALGRANAKAGVIPATSASAIRRAAKQRYEVVALAQGAVAGGNLAIPLVKMLTSQVARANARAAGHVHIGATSQDVIDTARMLQLRDALALIDRDLAGLSRTVAGMARRHRKDVMAGRTLLQQAVPVTLGLKMAGWLDSINRDRARVSETRRRCVALQFGGAAGTLATLGPRGPRVVAALARELRLPAPKLPWHSARDRMAEIATTLGIVTGTLGKIARDLALMAQTEVGEYIPPSGGGSSTMPHKRNPVACAVVLAAATRLPHLVATMLAAMSHEHERALGAWHAEWETLPEIVLLASGAVSNLDQALREGKFDTARMRTNLQVTHGLTMAEAVVAVLTPKLGRAKAQDHVEAACRRAVLHAVPLHPVLLTDPVIRNVLDAKALRAVMDPQGYLGSANSFAAAALRRKR